MKPPSNCHSPKPSAFHRSFPHECYVSFPVHQWEVCSRTSEDLVRKPLPQQTWGSGNLVSSFTKEKEHPCWFLWRIGVMRSFADRDASEHGLGDVMPIPESHTLRVTCQIGVTKKTYFSGMYVLFQPKFCKHGDDPTRWATPAYC